MMALQLQLLLLLLVLPYCSSSLNNSSKLDCARLLPGQYHCRAPEIDVDTQQAKNCSKDQNGNYTVQVPCYPVAGIECNKVKHTGETIGFNRTVSCKWTNGQSFETAILLSIFLGTFGIDRFYLGYPALGLLKFSTLGFMFLGQLIDILLIATQVVGPSDGSHYVINYYGAGLVRVARDNFTYSKPQ